LKKFLTINPFSSEEREDEDDVHYDYEKDAKLTPRGKVNYEKLTVFQYTKKLQRFWEQNSMFHCTLTRA
jgi:hypothetical protein